MNSDWEQVRRYVALQRRRWIIQTASARLQMIAIAVWLAVAAVQFAFWLLPWTGFPLLFDVTIIAGAAGCVAAIVDSALIHAPSLAVVARRLEQARAERHALLSVALSLGGHGTDALTRETLRRAAHSLRGYPSRHRFVNKPRAWPMAGAGALCAIALLLARPSAASFWRLPFGGGRIVASVYPGTVRIAKFSAVELSLHIADGRLPSCICEIHDLATATLRRRFLRPDSLNRFRLRLDSCASSFAYTFFTQGAGMNTDTIYVAPPPALYRIEIELRPPAYTGLSARRLPDGQGSFEAYGGTVAIWRIGATSPLQGAQIAPLDGEPHACVIQRGEAHAEMTIAKPMRYTIVLADSLGQRSDGQPVFVVDIIPDLSPRVNILRPGRNKALEPEQAETLLVEAVDDMGIRQCAVAWRAWPGGGDTSGTWDLSPPEPAPKEYRRALAWDLKPLRLYPGDTVRYWAIARDCKPFGPPQRAVSDTFWFRVPTFGEIQTAIARSQQGAERSSAEALRSQSRLKEELNELLSSAQDNQQLTWEEKQAVAHVAHELAAQRDSLRHAMDALQQMVQQIREQGMSNQTLLSKMERVQKTVEELIRQYGDSLLFQPPGPNEAVQWRDIRDALNKLQNMLPSLEQSLDNALNYLTMLQRDQQLASLASRAERLGRQQREIAGDAAAPAGECIRVQRQAAQDHSALLGDIHSLISIDSNPPMLSSADIPSLPQAQQHLAAIEADIAKNRMPSSENLNRMSGSLLSLAEELRAQLSSSMMLRAQREAAMLLDMARDALALSEWQEQIRAQAGEAPLASQPRRLAETIRSQQALRQALAPRKNSLDSMSMIPPELLAKISRSFGQAATATDQALKSLGAGGDAQAMNRSVAALNSLAQTLLQSSFAMDGMMQGQASGQGMEGMMCGLRKLSGKQAAVNAATAELLRMMLSGQESEAFGSIQGSEAARASAEAAQQDIAAKLRALANAYGKEAGGSLEAQVEELEKEARRLSRMLRNPDAEVKDRQERFLVRMLQASLSMHRQEEGDEKRASTTAAHVFTPSGTLSVKPAQGAADRLYRLRTQALRGNFPRQYRRAVEAYLDSLEAAVLQ